MDTNEIIPSRNALGDKGYLVVDVPLPFDHVRTLTVLVLW